MSKAKPTSNELATLRSLTQTSMAKLLGIGRTTLSESDAPRNSDKSYDAVKVVGWFVSKRLAETPSDPMLVGDGSAALERYRNARAKLAELDLSARRRELVSVGEMRDALGAGAGVVRAFGDELETCYGVAARQKLLDALDEIYRAGSAVFAKNEGKNESGNGRPTK